MATTKREKYLYTLFYFLLVCFVAIIFSFSLHSGSSSHNQSTEVKDTIKTVMQHVGMKFDRKFYAIYQPFMIKGEEVNGEAFIRKTAHVLEYFTLGLISAILIVLNKKKRRIIKYLLLFLGPIIALMDEEIIQRFLVVKRTSSIRDVMLDSIGFYLAVIVFCIVLLIFYRNRR